MTYRVEVSAATISELSGKLAALASQLKGLPSTFDVLKIEAAAPEPAPVAAPAPEPAPEVKTVVEEAPPAAQDVRVLDYLTEVQPRVLSMVAKRGRDSVKELLASFGVKRASELEPSRFGELLAAVDAAMGEG